MAWRLAPLRRNTTTANTTPPVSRQLHVRLSSGWWGNKVARGCGGRSGAANGSMPAGGGGGGVLLAAPAVVAAVEAR
eukprot:1173592-Prorocentrum_minimum.AAC.1